MNIYYFEKEFLTIKVDFAHRFSIFHFVEYILSEAINSFLFVFCKLTFFRSYQSLREKHATAKKTHKIKRLFKTQKVSYNLVAR